MNILRSAAMVLTVIVVLLACKVTLKYEMFITVKSRVAIRQVFPGHVRDFSGQICVREKC